jgi:hypothetical protein
MTHDSTWLKRTRAGRLGIALPLGLLLACLLMAGFAASASASSYEMRGEWEIVLEIPGQTLKGKTRISQEADAGGKFESGQIQFEMGLTGTFSGTLKGSEAEVVVSIPQTPLGPGEFKGNKITVNVGASTLVLSGSGEMTLGSNKATGTMVATRLRNQKQIEEQEAKEKLEKEERETRANVRGEWALTIKFGPETAHAVALITGEANSKNEFASAKTVFEGVDPGTFKGKLESGKATVKITTEAIGQLPPTEFTGTGLTVTSATDPTSISGAGTFSAAGQSVPGELTATRIHSYLEVKEREAKEKQEKQEKEEAEAKKVKETEEAKQAEEAAHAKQAREAKEAEEARAKLAREAKEKLEKEALAKLAPPLAALLSAEPSTKTITASNSGSLALGLTNPNAYAVQGHLALVVASSGAGKASAGKGKAKKPLSLGSASFTISAKGTETVKLKLSHAARADLSSHKTLRVTLTVITDASDMSGMSKTYSLTLHASGSGHKKG